MFIYKYKERGKKKERERERKKNNNIIISTISQRLLTPSTVTPLPSAAPPNGAAAQHRREELRHQRRLHQRHRAAPGHVGTTEIPWGTSIENMDWLENLQKTWEKHLETYRNVLETCQ